MFKREDFVKDVMRLLSIKSFTGDSVGILKCQQEYQKIAERMGFDTYFAAEGKVLLVEPKGMKGVPEIGMVVHLDTVPFNEKEWSFNPLGQIWNGRIYGRGVVDDKAAAVMALYAVYSLEGQIQNSWQIIIGSCEEGDWSDMDCFMKENPKLAKFLFTIDGDGVQHGCRGYVDLELIFRRKENLVLGRQLVSLSVPNATNNMVPAMVIANICGKEFVERGVAVHSSIPEEGENALMKMVSRIAPNDWVNSEFPDFFELMKNLEIGDLSESIGMHVAKLFCPDGCSTTVVPVDCKMINQDYLILTLNIRLCVHVVGNMISEMVSYISRKYDCSCYIKELKLPAYVSVDTKYIQTMLEVYEKVMGKPTKACVAKGTGYNAALPNCVIFGPRFDVEHDEKDFCHCVDEGRDIEDLLTFSRMLRLYLKRMLPKD